jgi:hypothetical protein
VVVADPVRWGVEGEGQERGPSDEGTLVAPAAVVVVVVAVVASISRSLVLCA